MARTDWVSAKIWNRIVAEAGCADSESSRAFFGIEVGSSIILAVDSELMRLRERVRVLEEGLDNFQREVGEWSQRTFDPNKARGSEPCLEHLSDEVTELCIAHKTGGDVKNEAADCFLLLLQYAHRMGFSLEKVARTKHAVNQTRTWGQPDERGVVRHLEEE